MHGFVAYGGQVIQIPQDTVLLQNGKAVFKGGTVVADGGTAAAYCAIGIGDLIGTFGGAYGFQFSGGQNTGLPVFKKIEFKLETGGAQIHDEDLVHVLYSVRCLVVIL